MTVTRTVLLGDVCKQDRTTVKTGERANLRYIGLESIESNTGRFNEGELSKTPEAPQANSFRFSVEHVLYGKLRPYLNKVALADFEGKCSTEIIPLLPSPDLDRRYLSYFLRSPQTVSRISEKTAGARMPRADMDFVFDLEMPLPNFPEQRRIVDILSRAEGIVRLRREAEKKAAELIPALFLDMFGDPATNPKGWPALPIIELCAVQTGGTPSRENAAYYEGEIPWVKTGEVTGGVILNTEEHISAQALAETNCKKFPVGTILVAMYGQGQTRGRCAMLGIEASTNQACAAVLPSDRIAGEFLFRLLQTQYEHLRSLAQGGNQANLNLSMIKNYSVILPPIKLQEEFIDRVSTIRSIQSQQFAASAKAQATFDALLARAFTSGVKLS